MDVTYAYLAFGVGGGTRSYLCSYISKSGHCRHRLKVSPPIAPPHFGPWAQAPDEHFTTRTLLNLNTP